MSKKVILVLVEGESDESLLIGRLKELFRGCNVRFEAMHGDCFYDPITMKPIKAVIGDKVKETMNKRKYKPRDILTIVQVIDSDGCFIPNDCVEVCAGQAKKTIYAEDKILVSDGKQKSRIIERNVERSGNVNTMNRVTSVIGRKYAYQLYFFSRNLEHVIFDEPNPIDDYKCKDVDDFIEGLDIPLEEFLANYAEEFDGDYSDQYKKSWMEIASGTNSLHRATNVPLLFKYLQIIVE